MIKYAHYLFNPVYRLRWISLVLVYVKNWLGNLARTEWIAAVSPSTSEQHLYQLFLWLLYVDIVYRQIAYSVNRETKQTGSCDVWLSVLLSSPVFPICQDQKSEQHANFRQHKWTKKLISHEWNRRLLTDTSISLKSAPPTPTIRMDSGRSDAFTIASFVSWRSVITPSFQICEKMLIEGKPKLKLHGTEKFRNWLDESNLLQWLLAKQNTYFDHLKELG